MKQQYKALEHYDKAPQIYPELESDKNSSLTCRTFQKFCSLYTDEMGFVFDIGCGTGRVGRFLECSLKPTPHSLLYFDISHKELELAKGLSNNSANRLFVHADILNLPISTMRFCSCHGVIHHTPAPDRALEQLASALSDGGIMYLAVYKKSWVTPLYKSFGVLHALRKCGLESIVMLAYVAYFIPRFILRILETGEIKKNFNIRASFKILS